MIKRGVLRKLAESIARPSSGTWNVERLRGAWKHLVGPSLAEKARPLAIRKGVLVLGCSDPALLSSLRQSSALAWPELQARIERLTRLKLAGVKVEPCDPQQPEPAKPVPADAFAEVLKRYRSLGKDPLDSRRR